MSELSLDQLVPLGEMKIRDFILWKEWQHMRITRKQTKIESIVFFFQDGYPLRATANKEIN
jgi:hypothetical protein